MALQAYTPFQSKILNTLEDIRGTFDLLEKDMLAFHKEEGQMVPGRVFNLSNWRVEMRDHLAAIFRERVNIASRFVGFRLATAEQEKEVLRFVNPAPEWKEHFHLLPLSLQKLVYEYLEVPTIQKAGDFTKSMFDGLAKNPKLKEYGETPKEIIANMTNGQNWCPDNSPVWEVPRQAMYEITRSFFPAQEPRVEALEQIKLSMLITNLQHHNAKPATCKVEELPELTPDG